MTKNTEISHEKELCQEYLGLIWISDEMRNSLENLTNHNLTIKRSLIISSGILSFIAAAILTAILVEYITSETLSIVVVLLVFIGGILALTGSFKYNHRDLITLEMGASKFLELLDRARYIALDKELSYDSRKTHLSEFWDEYTKLSSTYKRYIKISEPPKTPIYQLDSTSPSQAQADDVSEFQQKLVDEFRNFLVSKI